MFSEFNVYFRDLFLVAFKALKNSRDIENDK